ncbi:pyridoxine 5'-phosphate synthase [Sulfurimonas sp.]|uniref:pyridoxine 5'-phosphate synthase n=1 Tax=Sulfurimonas sp. TaxID=2022749 RepID=UPI003D0E1A22
MKLGVNIDHVAVLREAREVNDPDILQALYVACQSGADQITIHLREDRRHIQDIDVKNIVMLSKVPVNLECAIDKDIIEIVCQNKPHRATLVPEKRHEITTEGGLELYNHSEDIKTAIAKLNASEIPVSLFVDPSIETMEKSKELGAQMVELHTGHFANLFAMLNSSLPYSNHSIKDLELSRQTLEQELANEIEKIKTAAKHAVGLGLEVAAGHGLNYHNVYKMVKISEIIELNIGQSIVARSVFTGLQSAVKEMKKLTTRR